MRADLKSRGPRLDCGLVSWLWQAAEIIRVRFRKTGIKKTSFPSLPPWQRRELWLASRTVSSVQQCEDGEYLVAKLAVVSLTLVLLADLHQWVPRLPAEDNSSAPCSLHVYV